MSLYSVFKKKTTGPVYGIDQYNAPPPESTIRGISDDVYITVGNDGAEVFSRHVLVLHVPVGTEVEVREVDSENWADVPKWMGCPERETTAEVIRLNEDDK